MRGCGREREVRVWFSGGAGHLHATGPVADIKELEQLIQREVDRTFRANRAPARRERRSAYAFDALMKMGRGNGESGASGRSSTPRPTRLTFIRVDLTALMRGRVVAGEVCEIGGVAVSVSELRTLFGDSILQLVLAKGEAVIDVVNLHRKPTVAQMLAKLFTDSDVLRRGVRPGGTSRVRSSGRLGCGFR